MYGMWTPNCVKSFDWLETAKSCAAIYGFKFIPNELFQVINNKIQWKFNKFFNFSFEDQKQQKSKFHKKKFNDIKWKFILNEFVCLMMSTVKSQPANDISQPTKKKNLYTKFTFSVTSASGRTNCQWTMSAFR